MSDERQPELSPWDEREARAEKQRDLEADLRRCRRRESVESWAKRAILAIVLVLGGATFYSLANDPTAAKWEKYMVENPGSESDRTYGDSYDEAIRSCVDRLGISEADCETGLRNKMGGG